MNISTVLELKFGALMKNYETVVSSNEELNNHIEYLRRQLDELMKQKKKILTSSSGSMGKEESEKDCNPLDSSSEEEPQRRLRRE